MWEFYQISAVVGVHRANLLYSHNEEPTSDKSRITFIISTIGPQRRICQPNCIQAVWGNLVRSSSWGLALVGFKEDNFEGEEKSGEMVL